MRAAQDWINKTLKENQRSPILDAHKLTISEFLDDWIERCEKREMSPKTVDRYKSSVKKIKDEIGSIRVQELQTWEVQEMFDSLAKKPINIPPRKSKLPPEKRRPSRAKKPDEKEVRYPSAATIHAVHRDFRAAMNYARKIGIIKISPVFGIELPKQEPHQVTVYTGVQLSTLLLLAREMEHVLYFPLVLTVLYGLRRGEALGVRWRDIDFDNSRIKITKNLTMSSGRIFLKGVKNIPSEDYIALSEWTSKELRKLQRQRMSEGLMTMAEPDDRKIIDLADLRVSDFVCLDADNALFIPDGMLGRLQSFQRANGLPESSWHDLRHTYGTLMIEDGVDIAVVSKAMRHSSVKITSDIYISNTLTIKKKATSAFENIVKLPGMVQEADMPGTVKNDDKI